MLVLQRGHSGDGCDLASTLCKYDLRKGDLFVLSWDVGRYLVPKISAYSWWNCPATSDACKSRSPFILTVC